MRIWVDADACPEEIKTIIIRASERVKVQTIFVANKFIRLPKSPLLSSIRVESGPDIADNKIACETSSEDIVITADIPLAAILVEKGANVVDPRGDIYTQANIGERLSIRDFMSDLRGAGVTTSGPRPLDEKSKKKFAAALDTLLTRLLKKKINGAD